MRNQQFACHIRRALKTIACTAAFALAFACLATHSASAEDKGSFMSTTTPSGLEHTDTVTGTGASPTKGQTCVMHYTGWLRENGVKGTKFDSSHDRGQPFQCVIGTGRVIKGWDQGLIGMKVGGKRKLFVPAHLAYGERQMGAVIKPNSNLIFEIELLEVLTRDE